MLPVIKLYSIFRNSFVESSFAGFEETYPSIVAGEMILARLDEIEPFFVSMIIPTVIADKELDRLVHQSANRFAVILAAAFVIKFSLMKCINSRTAEHSRADCSAVVLCVEKDRERALCVAGGFYEFKRRVAERQSIAFRYENIGVEESLCLFVIFPADQGLRARKLCHSFSCLGMIVMPMGIDYVFYVGGSKSELFKTA